jgi:copper chaperone CopZ
VCAHAVRVAMQKVDGVTSVTVSLNEGTLTLTLAPTNRVTVARIREAIRANGFTPKDAEVRVVGRVVARGDTLLLVVPETSESFALEDAPGAAGRVGELQRGHVGTQVIVSGTVPESAKVAGARALRLRVRSVAAAPSPPAMPRGDC